MKFVFDIDNTIFGSTYNDGKYNVTHGYKSIIKKINKLYGSGHTIIIQTGRHWNHLEDTIKQLNDCKIKYHTLVMGNIPADYYINDKGITPEYFDKNFKELLKNENNK